MQILTLVFSIMGFLFGLAGFALGAWAVIDLLASKRSTHRITQLPVELEETKVTHDLTQHVLDQLPSPPEQMSVTDYLKWQARQAAEDDYDE